MPSSPSSPRTFRRSWVAAALLGLPLAGLTGLSACTHAETPADAVAHLPAREAAPPAAAATETGALPDGPRAWVEEVRHVAHGAADVDVRYYRVHLPSAAASEALSTHLHDWAMASVASMERDAEDAASESDLPPEMPRFGLTIRCTPHVVSPELVSLRCDVAGSYGGAHPNLVVETFNFAIDGDTVRAVGLDDLFLDPKAGRAALGEVCLAKLTAQDAALWVTEGNVTDLHEMVDTFHLERGKLVVTFAPYEVGPFAEGPHVVEVPAALLRGLRPGWARRLEAIP